MGEDYIQEPNENDVLCGRGGTINSHPGNERFRSLVEKRKRVYLTARFKREKRLIASSIVSEIRGSSPPGRFLSKDLKTGFWKDIGDEKARDKASQALREGAPTIRAEIEEEINEKREEAQANQQTPPQPAGHHSYYSAPPPAWGYPYYPYPPPPPQGAPHATPPVHYPYPPPHPSWYSYPPPPPPQEREKSPLEKTADYVASSTESVKKWAESSMIWSEKPRDNIDNQSVQSKPLSYMHHDDSKKRRMVKFRDDDSASIRHISNRRKFDHHEDALMDPNTNLDPLNHEDQDQNASLMTQVADRILSTFGSWDTSTFCGGEVSEENLTFRNSLINANKGQPRRKPAPSEDMTVEWEGQEVQLMEPARPAIDDSREQMPPPEVRRRSHYDGASSIAFSSLGSCHSWLPDHVSATASLFSWKAEDQSAATGHENFSVNESVGGASLTRVFENESQADANSHMTPVMTHRSLSQMPSWERNIRSRSPLSIGSDDMSLISKTSSKVSESHLALSNEDEVEDKDPADTEMAWETKE